MSAGGPVGTAITLKEGAASRGRSIARLAQAPDEARRPRTWSRQDLLELGACALAAAFVVASLHVVLDWRSLVGATLWWFGAFLAIYRTVTRATRGPIVAGDRMMTVVILGGSTVTFATLGWLMLFVVGKGLPALRAGFFTQDLSTVGPLNPGGGALHAIIGTLEQVGLAALVAVPLAILTAVYLNELRGRLAPVVRFFVDAMSGLPSIIAGLLVYTVWIVGQDGGFSGAAAAGALAVLMLPTVTRTAEEILKTVPGSLREAALALGAPLWRVVARVVLPTARSGVVTAAILGVARAVGETAPMLLTAFGSPNVNPNPFEGPQADLPLFVFGLLRQPNEVQIGRAWAGALVLVLIVLTLFILARVLGESRRVKPS